MSNQSFHYDETHLSRNLIYKITLKTQESYLCKVISIGVEDKETRQIKYNDKFRISVLGRETTIIFELDIKDVETIEIIARNNLSEVLDLIFPQMKNQSKPNWGRYFDEKYGVGRPGVVSIKGKSAFYSNPNFRGEVEQFEPIVDLSSVHTEENDFLSADNRTRAVYGYRLREVWQGSQYWWFSDLKIIKIQSSRSVYSGWEYTEPPRFGKYNLDCYKHYNPKWIEELEEEIYKNKVKLSWKIINEYCNKLLIRVPYQFEVFGDNFIKGLPDGEMIREIKILNLPNGVYKQF